MHELQQKYRLEIEALVTASNYIAEKGYVTSQGGNLSNKVAEDIVLITPTMVAKKDIRFDDITIIDFESNVLFAGNGRKPTGETPFHLHILKKRSDLNALVHAHPPVITGLAIAHSDLLSRPLLPEPILEVGPVLTVPYKTPLSQELADAFDAVVLRSNAFLMQNHGIVLGSTVGITRGVEYLEMIEAMAISLTTAVTLGNVVEIPEEGLQKLDDLVKSKGFPLPGMPGVNSSLVELYQRS